MIGSDLDLQAAKEPDMPRKAKENTACGHLDRPHYARNMCRQCYNAERRSAWDSDYNASEKGAERHQRYEGTEKASARRKRYDDSGGRERYKRYNASDKGKARSRKKEKEEDSS